MISNFEIVADVPYYEDFYTNNHKHYKPREIKLAIGEFDSLSVLANMQFNEYRIELVAFMDDRTSQILLYTNRD